MGIDAGFDMFPRLSEEPEDAQKWARFINIIKLTYKDDPQIEIKPNYILFNVGEGPRLPFQGHKFLRFSSKISGRCSDAETYLKKVFTTAKSIFGSRVHYYSNLFDGYVHDMSKIFGYYDWRDVHASISSYDKVSSPAPPLLFFPLNFTFGFDHEPEKPQTSPNTEQCPNSSNTLQECEAPLYEVTDVPGKGKGMIARTNIPKGTRIVCEKPILVVPLVHPNELEKSLAVLLRKLSKTDQRQFLSLHNNFPGKSPFSGIVRTNSLPYKSDRAGVYAVISRINHCCLPNCTYAWNDAAEHETIYAFREIAAGEEITISYDIGRPRDERRAFLKQKFGFDCTCKVCALSPDKSQASDSRRRRILDLDDAIGMNLREPEEGLQDCFSLLQLVNEEYEDYATVKRGRLFYDAFQICILNSDQARAGVFAERAYKERVIQQDEDHPETQLYKSLSLDPAAHAIFEKQSKRWKTEKNQVKGGLDAAQFEKWLWRQQT